jgi:hypothetical protein
VNEKNESLNERRGLSEETMKMVEERKEASGGGRVE